VSEASPIEQVTLDRLFEDPATSFALEVVIEAWAKRDSADAAHDASLLCVALARAADHRLGLVK